MPGSGSSSLSSFSFVSPGSSFLTYQVSSSGLPSVSSSQASDQTSNSQSLSLSSQGQSAPSSNTNLQEDKIEGNLRISSEVPQHKQPARCMCLCKTPASIPSHCYRYEGPQIQTALREAANTSRKDL